MARRRRSLEYESDRIERRGHHVLFYGAQWEAMVATNALRKMRGLQTGPNRREPHDRLHRHIEHVPALSQYMAGNALSNYIDTPGDTLRSMDSLMKAIELAQKHPRATPVEIALADLTIQAVDLQRPYVREMQADR